MKKLENFFKNKSKSDYVHELFDELSADYDILNDVISMGQHKFVKKQAIKNVRIRTGMKILDVCTGTGDIPLFIAKKFVDNVKIIGADFSDNMLEIAKKRTQNYKNIEIINADAMNLPFEDETFDVVFISFGLRNLNDLKKGIEELKRVTRKNGYVVNLDVGKPKGIFFHPAKLYFYTIVPLLGKLIHGKGEPYSYLHHSREDFPEQDELVKIFYELGFSTVKKHDFMFGVMSQQIARV